LHQFLRHPRYSENDSFHPRAFSFLPIAGIRLTYTDVLLQTICSCFFLLQEHSICRGRFDFAKAAANVNKNAAATPNSISLDIFKEQVFFNPKTPISFYLGWGFSANINVKISGTAGVNPVIAWENGGANGCASGTTYVGGVRPYGKLSLILEAYVEWARIAQVGVSAQVTLISLAFPAYGRLIPDRQTYSTCGSVEFEKAAFSGTIEAFFKFRSWSSMKEKCGNNCNEWGQPWSFTVYTWRGYEEQHQLKRTGTNSGVCAWKSHWW
jgi:hypothetical protein